jgi:hypothetical protein
MATLKHVTIVHPKYGEVLNETFMDEVQFKLFLKMVHVSIELGENLTTFNGKDFLIQIQVRGVVSLFIFKTKWWQLVHNPWTTQNKVR